LVQYVITVQKMRHNTVISTKCLSLIHSNKLYHIPFYFSTEDYSIVNHRFPILILVTVDLGLNDTDHRGTGPRAASSSLSVCKCRQRSSSSRSLSICNCVSSTWYGLDVSTAAHPTPA